MRSLSEIRPFPERRAPGVRDSMRYMHWLMFIVEGLDSDINGITASDNATDTKVDDVLKNMNA